MRVFQGFSAPVQALLSNLWDQCYRIFLTDCAAPTGNYPFACTADILNYTCTHVLCTFTSKAAFYARFPLHILTVKLFTIHQDIKVSWIKVQLVFHMINSSVSFRLEDNRVVCLNFCLHVSREASVSDVCASVADLWDVVDGGLHAAELWRLDVEHLQDIVGQRVDQVGYAGQRLGSVVLGLLQRPLLVWRLSERKERMCLKQTVYLHFTVCNRRPSVVHTERGG